MAIIRVLSEYCFEISNTVLEKIPGLVCIVSVLSDGCSQKSQFFDEFPNNLEEIGLTRQRIGLSIEDKKTHNQ